MRAAVFSGTTEGREICAFLSEKRIITTVCVATEYGAEVMEKMKYITLRVGRMNAEKMTELVKGCDFVIDATHPYAEEATANIKKACAAANREYMRLLRRKTEASGAVTVSDIASAAEYLKNKSGNAFLSTGSRDLDAFSEIRERCAARVLDTEEIRKKCDRLGFGNIIYARPPFSYEDNLKAFQGCDFLVTKDSGKEGGLGEKLRAARSLGMEVILVSRPEEDGMSAEEIKARISRKRQPRFPVFVSLAGRRVTVAGAGRIASGRIKALADFGADITVIAPEVYDEEILNYAELHKRKFKDSDIDGAFLVVAATDSREINHRIYELCSERGILVSVADNKDESEFYFPAICRGERLVAGIVSDGTAHKEVRDAAEGIRRILK